MAKFGTYESNSGEYWSPEYGGIDWGKRQEVFMADDQLEQYNPVGFDSEDGLIVECTQENLTFRLNRVAPDMDMVAMRDVRDDQDYIWFRDNNPERFAYLYKSLGRAALVITSEYPLEDTVRIYLDRAAAGNDTEFLEEA